MEASICKTVEEVEKKLTSLGDVPEDIAERLYALDCSGYPSRPCSCPIAIFLEKYCGLSEPTVAPDKISFRFAHDLKNVVYLGVGPSQPLWYFIIRFDQGRFAQLNKKKTNA